MHITTRSPLKLFVVFGSPFKSASVQTRNSRSLMSRSPGKPTIGTPVDSFFKLPNRLTRLSSSLEVHLLEIGCKACGQRLNILHDTHERRTRQSPRNCRSSPEFVLARHHLACYPRKRESVVCHASLSCSEVGPGTL